MRSKKTADRRPVTDQSRSVTARPATRKPAISNALKSTLLASAFVVAIAIPIPRALAASKSSGIVSALEKKYAVTEMTPDHEQVTKNGTTMAMKTAGVYSLPASSILVPETKVTDGKIQPPSMLTRMTLTNMGTHVLQAGDKVYITKIESKDDNGGQSLHFTLLTVDDLNVNGQDAQKKFTANVSFRFKKGYLDEAAPEEVEQAIEAVLAPDEGGDDSQGGGNQGDGGQGQPQGRPPPPQPPPPPRPVAVAPPPPPPPAAPAGPPPTIKIGETSTQVLQDMGMPQQMIDLGKKKTYIYKNMKIIFVDDKVSDVQ